MYFKTAKDSETGKKFAEVYERGREAHEARERLLEELMEKFPAMTGKFREPGGFIIWGGIYSIVFSEEPDPNVWLKGEENEYMPLETDEGSEIAEKIHNLPVVKYTEINACLDHYDNKNVVGFKGGKEHFGFEIHPEWGIEIPEDCQEILYSEYEKL